MVWGLHTAEAETAAQESLKVSPQRKKMKVTPKSPKATAKKATIKTDKGHKVTGAAEVEKKKTDKKNATTSALL